MDEILQAQRDLVLELQSRAKVMPTQETLSALSYAIQGLRDLELLKFETSQPRRVAVD